MTTKEIPRSIKGIRGGKMITEATKEKEHAMTDKHEWKFTEALKDARRSMKGRPPAKDFRELAYWHSNAMIRYKNLTSAQCRRIVEIVDADLLRSDDDK